jgi:menaquinone-9 beta-reductase
MPAFNDLSRQELVAGAAAGTGVIAAGLIIRRMVRNRLRKGPLTPESLPDDGYDAVVVGAGPSGAVCAYYLAKGGAKVALLDKETFPREKVCGDAVCTPAIEILRDMNVIDELEAEGKARFADNGGFVSPSGLSYIGNSVHQLGAAAACAVKRIHLDEKVARAAAKAGAKLIENFEVSGPDVSFDPEAKLWTVTSTSGTTVRGRMLVCADGATSRLATHLGLCNAPPLGVSSRAYIAAGSHNTAFDGACFYPRWSLPGYAAMFKHANDDIGYCYYLIPCGRDASKGQLGHVTAQDLKRLHDEGIARDPFISRAMGPAPKAERMKAGSLRVGSQGVTASFADHVIVVGDAAGHIDPLTGEGIHTAMMGGKIAAETILEIRSAGDYSAANTARFERRWKARFGHDFYWSQAFANAIYRCPILLDAVANEVQRVGDPMMSAWAEVATCMRHKTYFFRPDVAVPLTLALIREAWVQKVMKRPSSYVMPPSAQGRGDGKSNDIGNIKANGTKPH